MKKLHVPFLFLFFLSAISFGQPVESVRGNWLGNLELPSVKLRIGLIFSESEDGQLQAVMNSIDQGAEIPMPEVRLMEDSLQVKHPGAGIEFVGIVDLESNTFTSEFKQGGASFPIIFQKVDKLPGMVRPQEPQPPFPYKQEEVSYENGAADISIAGTLTIPEGEGPFPAVILLTGSGPQNRNEELFGHKPFLVLADYLTRRGIAVLRSDDRGVGGTTGIFQEATTGDFAEDALAGVAYLQTRKEIDPEWIGLAGHSEGGMMAPIAAAQSGDVGFIVLMAAPAIPFSEVILLQREQLWKRSGNSEAEMEMKRAWHRQVSAIISEDISMDMIRDKVLKTWEDLNEEQRKLLGKTRENVEAEIDDMTKPWWIYANRYDAGVTLGKVSCPVLAINGSKDVQVRSEENLGAIKKALQTNDHKNFKIVELDGLNHLFQTADTGAESEYLTIEETFSEDAMSLIANWVLDQAGRAWR